MDLERTDHSPNIVLVYLHIYVYYGMYPDDVPLDGIIEIVSFVVQRRHSPGTHTK